MHVLLIGDPIDGMRVVGPVVPNAPETDEYIDGELRNDTWWMVEVQQLPALSESTERRVQNESETYVQSELNIIESTLDFFASKGLDRNAVAVDALLKLKKLSDTPDSPDTVSRLLTLKKRVLVEFLHLDADVAEKITYRVRDL